MQRLNIILRIGEEDKKKVPMILYYCDLLTPWFYHMVSRDETQSCTESGPVKML